jgi:hypothetical protein
MFEPVIEIPCGELNCPFDPSANPAFDPATVVTREVVVVIDSVVILRVRLLP